MRSHLANSFLKKMEVLIYIHLPFPMFVEHALFLTFCQTSDTRILYTSPIALPKKNETPSLRRPFWRPNTAFIVFGSCRLAFPPSEPLERSVRCLPRIVGAPWPIHVRMLLKRGSAGGWPPLCQKTLGPWVSGHFVGSCGCPNLGEAHKEKYLVFTAFLKFELFLSVVLTCACAQINIFTPRFP